MALPADLKRTKRQIGNEQTNEHSKDRSDKPVEPPTNQDSEQSNVQPTKESRDIWCCNNEPANLLAIEVRTEFVIFQLRKIEDIN